jgi:hypothetical protein
MLANPSALRSRAHAVRLACALAWTVGLVLALAAPTQAGAAVGVKTLSYAGSTAPSAPTGEKPQSKLWFNDGSWWGTIWGGSSFTIQRFDAAAQSWVDTKTLVDRRAKSHADMLWDGSHLYALSTIGQGGATTDPGVRLYRFSYSAGARTYALDTGFPVTIFTPASSDDLETAVLDQDSKGILWATFTYANQPGNCVTKATCPAGRSVYIAHTSGGDSKWTTPRVLPVANAATVSGDDISTVVHFGSKIGVLFSDQTPDPGGLTADYFAVHNDGAADTLWSLETALHDVAIADDHLNAKAAPDGRVFAAVKTSRNDLGAGHEGDPLVLLLVRATDGTWSQSVFDVVAGQETRSQVVLAPDTGTLYQLATYPPDGSYEGGGWIFYKSTSMNAPAFAPGRGSPFIQLGGGDSINNISTTKQTVGASTGLLGVASDDPGAYYLHNFLSLAPTPPPGGGGVGPGGGGGGPTATSARVSLRALWRHLRTVRRHRRLRLRITANGPMTLTVSVTLRRRGRKAIVIARARLRFKAAGTRRVSIKLTKSGRRALAHRRRVRLSVLTRARGADGKLVAARTRLTLR